jgi:uncharacterized small protein (DUF1192 family)
MANKTKSDLSHEDIIFLKTVQEIEDNPSNYRGTDKSLEPANTSVIVDICDLAVDQIRYRMKPSPNGRGFESLGLAELYDPKLLENGALGPRSISLTDEGRKKIVDWEKRYGEIEADDWDQSTVEEIEVEISQLRSEVDRLDSELARRERAETSDGGEDLEELQAELKRLQTRVDALSGAVSDFQGADYGAWDDKKVGAIENLFETSRGFVFIFEELGISNPKSCDEWNFDDPETGQRIRAEVREALGISGAPGEETTTPPERGTLDQQAQREVPPDQPVDEVDLQNDGSSSG